MRADAAGVQPLGNLSPYLDKTYALTRRASHHGVMPPLTHRVWPVTNEASSLAK